MKRTITISKALYSRLEQTVKQRGLANVEQLLEIWQAVEDELARRSTSPQDAGRVGLFAYYGELAALGRQEPLE